MPIPLLAALAGAKGAAAAGVNVAGLAGAAGGSPLMGLAKGALGKGGRRMGRRRRRRLLTASQKVDLMWVAQNLGKTAAANYLTTMR